MAKAQVGDLIRILPTSLAVENGWARPGEIAEVTAVADENSGVSAKGGTGPFIPLEHHEYEIHRKAGEEDTSDVCACCGNHYESEKDYRGFCSEECHDDYNGLEPMPDAVNSPNHYTQGRFEVIDVIEDAVVGADPFEAVCQANIIKYTLRYRHKNGVEDLKKARWYLDKLISVKEVSGNVK